MITCLGKNCLFGLLCVSFVNVYKFMCVCPLFPFGLEGGNWDLVVLISDHCLSIYFSCRFLMRENHAPLTNNISITDIAAVTLKYLSS